MKKYLLICTVLLTGCVAPRWGSDNSIKFSPASESIQNDSSLYVSMPEDGKYGTKVYPTSGEMVQTELVNQLSVAFRSVEFAFKSQSLEDNLADAKRKKAKFLIVPTITHWEDRNTAWSNTSDKLGLFIEVIDTASKNTVNSARLFVDGPNRAFSNQHPESLLPDVLEEYVNSLSSLKDEN